MLSKIIKIMENTMENFGKQLKRERINKKISQTCLAKLVGCKRANIANIESGRIYPSFRVLVKLKEILALNISRLAENQEKNEIQEVRNV